MQIIGTRPGCPDRINLPFHRTRQTEVAPPFIEHATDGSPWVVVDDHTDNPAIARHGYCWVLDIVASSRTFGDAIEVRIDAEHPGVRVLRSYLRANPHLVDGRLPQEIEA